MTVGSSSVCVVVPAYNEATTITEVVRALTDRGWQVVVVDDGSTDDTVALARDAGAVVLRHPLNRGQGAALQTGFDYFLARTGAAYCVTFDADGQHRVEDVAAMVRHADQRGLDVVLASRFLGTAEQMPRSRRLLLRAAVRFSRLTSGLPLTDTHNGLRVLSRATLSSIRLTQDRMAYATELETAIARSRRPWAEYPTTVVYTAYSMAKGQTNSNAINIMFDLAVNRIRQPR